MDLGQENILSVQVGDFSLYVTPWVPGTKSKAYYGPIGVTEYCASTGQIQVAFDRAIHGLIHAGRKACKDTNAVIGLEIQYDPFYEDASGQWIEVKMTGTAANLVPLY